MAEGRPASRAAVLGRPVAHSLSPPLHRAAYAALNLDWTYTAIECGVEELPAVLAARADWAGFSCTMPLKRAVVALADEVRPRAAAAGAGNTLLPRDGGWTADNTDVDGILAALAERGVRPRRATVLGAGGTAQALLVALAELELPKCAALVRDPARTADLRLTADRTGLVLDVDRLAPTAPALDADLIVSTLPRGAADWVAARTWRADQTVLDVLYDPWPTALATAAAAAGAAVIGGAAMLLHGAAAQVRLMTGLPAPVPAMRAGLLAAAPSVAV
jgi:shikimate dehydrogenase